MASPLTPKQKENKKARTNLVFQQNSIRSAWSAKLLHTWHDVYKKMGYTDDYIANNTSTLPHPPTLPLTYPELKAHFDRQTCELEAKLKGTEPATIDVVATVTPSAQTDVTLSAPKANIASAEKPVQASSNEEGLTSDNDYGLTMSPKESKDLHYFWFQKKAITEAVDKIINKRLPGILILSGTGTGKTFMVWGVERRLLDVDYHEGKTWASTPYLYITKTTVVEQAKRVAKRFHNIDTVNEVDVINIETLRAKAGQMWVKELTRVVDGEEEKYWIWKKNIHPCVVFFDESQGAKNSTSKQHKIMCAYSNIPANATIVHISATPFARVCEAKCFAISTHRNIEHLGFPPGSILCEDTWPAYAKIISSPSVPDAYNQAAIERLMEDLKDYVVRVRGVKPQFNPRNSVKIIPFENHDKRIFYMKAEERFIAELQKAQAEADAGLIDLNKYRFAILLKFAMAAEECHAEGFADAMWEDVQKGYAAHLACKFKGTVIKVVQILMDKYGVSRKQISLVWGGGQTQLTAKQKAKKKILEQKEKFESMGLTVEDLLETTNLNEVEDRQLLDIDPRYQLGPQDLDARQEEIDRFQDGTSLFCCYTFKAGGVGLSLHHSDELTKDWNRQHPEFQAWYDQRVKDGDLPSPGKVRRKKSGYAFVEDIKFIPVRQRKGRLAPTYNAIELAQGVGRVPRLTSLSETIQEMICYEGTIEMDIGRVVSQKLRCLGSVIKMHESFMDVIIGGMTNPQNKTKIVQELLDTTKDVKDDESTLVDGDDAEEDDE